MEPLDNEICKKCREYKTCSEAKRPSRKGENHDCYKPTEENPTGGN